jgi:hypothetical protein
MVELWLAGERADERVDLPGPDAIEIRHGLYRPRASAASRRMRSTTEAENSSGNHGITRSLSQPMSGAQGSD